MESNLHEFPVTFAFVAISKKPLLKQRSTDLLQCFLLSFIVTVPAFRLIVQVPFVEKTIFLSFELPK